MPKPTGRATSRLHTPALVRDLLLAAGPEGDYIAHIHQQVKLRLRLEKPGYVWPRAHSFKSLVRNLVRLGLVEPTGAREPGALDPALGFQQRTFVRLAPGAEDSPLWSNPMGAGGAGQAAPLLEAPAALPRRVPAREAPEVLAQDLGPRVERLERERQALVQRLVAASETPGRAEDFDVLHQAARRFLGGISAVYDRDQFPEAAEAMEQLANCIRLFEAERALTQRRVQALRNCQRWAGLLADSLGSALAIPRGDAAALQQPREVATPVANAYARLKEARPNVRSGERALAELEAQGVDVAEAREKLEEYQAITRDDYEGGAEGAEEYREAREEAWTDFLDTLEGTEEREEPEE